ncbi:MAG: 4Fe-4S dicluster domain-containing protein [Bacillota bacterium]
MKLRMDDVAGAVEILAQRAEVYAPIDEDGQVLLKRWQGEELATSYVNTDNSLKTILYPQTQEIARFEGGYEDMSVSKPPPPGEMVIFGGRPCDALALARTARVLTEGEFCDEDFRRRRERTTVITVACEEAGPNCFCTAMVGSPAGTRGSDVVCYPLEGYFYLDPVTERGAEVISLLRDQLEDAPEDEVERARERCGAIPVPAADGLSVGGLGEDLFDHPYWSNVSGRCLSCGICGYVCPSCYCFAIFDSTRGTSGRRMRGWDSCQFENYLLMAADHNPRPTSLERVRQRFMHKLVYFPEEYGEMQCVGCGRCVERCPVGLHMLAVITDLEEVV